jgi:glycosyltransferase involved in cell wall biosynthesis
VLIATEHGLYKTKKRRQIFIDRLLSYVTDKIIVVSNAVKIYAHTQSKIPSNRFEVIYNFVDPEQFVPRRSRKDMRCELGLEANDIVVGSTGRLVKEKGYDFLLKAIKLLLEGGKDLKLVLVGDGPYLEVLKKKAQLYHIQNNIIFLGNRRDVPDLLNIMDVFVMPTLEEGFGLSIIEAQLFNLPVIASEVDGIPEIIEDGISGLLVPPKNYEALSKAINLLLKNESLSKKLGKAGHEIVLEKFVANVQANHLSSLYESLMREKLDSKRKWSWKI